MSSSDTLNLFSSLSKHVQRAIDDAFDTSVNPNCLDSGFRPSKRRKISVEPINGGFLVEPTSPDASASTSLQATPECNRGQIPLDVIPATLQRLDLPPDDEEVLSVFRNAASGWASLQPPTTSVPETRYVSRDDWRAVCAVLLENGLPKEDQECRNGYDNEVGGSSDEYVDEYNSEGTPSAAFDSEDEYLGESEGNSSRRKKGAANKSRQGAALSFDDLKAQAKSLTQRQRQTCLDTYALFFPHITTSKLEKQRIMIKDLQRIAKCLNEKLKTDEMLEMLEMFSTSPDKTMGFEDFTCMMMSAKLA